MKSFADLLKGQSGEERIGSEESIARAVLHFLKNEKGSEKQLSYVEMSEIQSLTTTLLLGDLLDIPFMKDFVQNFLLLRVSTDRKGRAEVVDMIKHRLIDEEKAKLKETIDQLTASRLGAE